MKKFEAGIIRSLIHEIFLVWSTFENFSNSFICKNERITLDGVKFKVKMDFKKMITERYPGEVYHGICRCVEWRSITKATVLNIPWCTYDIPQTHRRKLPVYS